MTVSITGTELTVYAGQVMHDYILSDVFSNDTMLFYGPEDAEELNQPIVLHGDAGFLDDGADHADTDGSITAGDIPLFLPLKASNRVKKRSVEERPGLQHLRNLGESHGKSIGKGKTLALMLSLAKTANLHGDELDLLTYDVPTDEPKTVKNALKALAAAMDEAEVDNEGRFGLLKSTTFYELADQDGVMSVDFGGQANRQTIGGNMDAIRYNNIIFFNVGIGFGQNFTGYGNGFNTSNINIDLTNYVGLVWQKRAWAYRQQTPLSGMIDWVGRLQVWQVLSRMTFGYKAITNADSTPKGPGNGGIWSIIDTR